MSEKKSSGSIYRIMDFARVVELFNTNELYFASPSEWDDPYEKRGIPLNGGGVFAQCWCQLAASDAMWRIYSQHGMGVRISTFPTKLEEQVTAGVMNDGLKWRGGPVAYLPQFKLDEECRALAGRLRQDSKAKHAVEMLYMKREAFQHESEWRATIYHPVKQGRRGGNGIKVRVDAHDLVNRILLDPRAPDALIDAFKFYFEKKLKFKGRVGRSVLYRSPDPIDFDDEEDV
ncbi:MULTISPECIES: DUF2971 domain-containing protein [unclassified Stenotrophomonas]|uniref:DUF2971 domain-containing protein n=1 Tax=unclassified Stenotrophomonas TaxID=196198 RepID=UPI0021189A0A|nr:MULTISPECIES: DUF2971 domain-containing protein [unclassified Stenotrophomonas]